MKTKGTIFIILAVLLAVLPMLASCSKTDEISASQAETYTVEGLAEILARTVTKPWQGQDFAPGKLGGTWYARESEEPRTFNLIHANGDNTSSTMLDMMSDYFLDYNVVTRAWEARAISVELRVNEAAGTMDIICTLRDDMYWSFYGSSRKEKVTTDDVIFWYDEIYGNEDFEMSEYWSQWVDMEDGSEEHIDIEKINDRTFVYHYPRITSEPYLSINSSIYPRFGYEEALRRGGVEAVENLFNITTDPRLIPSMGEYFLVEYTPGQRLVYERNPDYWNKDRNNVSTPYYERYVVRIIPDTNTSKLLFLNGELEAYGLRPEDLDEIVNHEKNGTDYTVYNAEGTLTAPFWSFNQNPINSAEPWYEWFIQKEFRQAMSCLLNRDRIAAQVYRGLADPKYNIYPEPNAFYDPSITLSYRFDPARAVSLLRSIGITQDSSGIMRDSKGRAIEFDHYIQTDSTIYTDMAEIIRDELEKVGIKMNVRVVEFQSLVGMLLGSYDWSSLFISLSGSQIWPVQGSNVWPSAANLHLWYPYQDTPATDWEARIDYLYNEGVYTPDFAKAKPLWDEFQRILLEQCPLIYLMRRRSFQAINNRWDMTNVYYDNLNGFEITHVFQR
ncbi:MAG: ABC transporter substrate-binding protein [Treponema sp.]|jgi:peptide/nickel transport system substrate-binding protein|nr:ABC transporter substrate-binding protein [Treponema sp.]